MKCKKRVIQGMLIKEHQGGTISKEFDEFLRQYFAIVEEQLQQIDAGKNKLGYNRFLNRRTDLIQS